MVFAGTGFCVGTAVALVAGAVAREGVAWHVCTMRPFLRDWIPADCKGSGGASTGSTPT